MPLKLSNFNPQSLAVLNQWAAQHENQLQAHETQLNNISTFLNRLFTENPTLVKPNSK